MNRTESGHGRGVVIEGGPGGVPINHRMVALFDRAQQKVAEARNAIEDRDTRLKGELLRSVIAVIDGIRGGLDFETDGEMAFNLASLYDHMERLLVEANVLGDPTLLDEVSQLLDELKSGQAGIALDERKV